MSTDSNAQDAALGHPLPAVVDYLVAAAIAVVGVALLAGGSVVTLLFDRAFIAEGIDAGQITVVVFERNLSAGEMLVFADRVLSWTGIGLVVTGLVMVAFAVWYGYRRFRAHKHADEPASFRSTAVLGAVATGVLSFIPFSPVLGGGLAGYLDAHHTGRPIQVGALAGFFAMLPGLSILSFTTIGLFQGLTAVGEAALAILVVVMMLIVGVFVIAYGGGLGAVGGFVGARLADNQS